MSNSSAETVIAWLIEVGTPAIYYCGEGDWCNNANHALKFHTKEAAQLRAAGMITIQPVRVEEHIWS